MSAPSAKLAGLGFCPARLAALPRTNNNFVPLGENTS